MDGENKTVQEIYSAFPELDRGSISGRIHENIGKCFEKVGVGTYRPFSEGEIAERLKEKVSLPREELGRRIVDFMKDGKVKSVSEIFAKFNYASYKTLRTEMQRNPKLEKVGIGLYRIVNNEEVEVHEEEPKVEGNKELLESLKLVKTIIEKSIGKMEG